MAVERADRVTLSDDDRFAVLHAIALRGTIPVLPHGAEALLDEGLIARVDGQLRLSADGYRLHRELLRREAAIVDLAGLELAGGRVWILARRLRRIELAWRGMPGSGERDRIAGELCALIDETEPVIERSATYLPRLAGYASRLDDEVDQIRGGDRTAAADAVDAVLAIWHELHEDFLQTLGRAHEI